MGNVESFLIKSRSQRMKEVNGASGELNVCFKCLFIIIIKPEALYISALR